MWDTLALRLPPGIAELEEATRALGFTMRSDPLTLDLLRTLAATKVAGRFLELGTGTGISASWIRDGIDAQSQLITVDHHEDYVALAKRFLEPDPRVHCILMDGEKCIASLVEQGRTFDVIFADMEVGKYQYLDETLRLLAVGGIYVIDHMLAQSSWDQEHLSRALHLISILEQRQDVQITKLNWSTGVVLAAKVQQGKKRRDGCLQSSLKVQK
jgi:predicted O-methyltransferase YrrM